MWTRAAGESLRDSTFDSYLADILTWEVVEGLVVAFEPAALALLALVLFLVVVVIVRTRLHGLM